MNILKTKVLKKLLTCIFIILAFIGCNDSVNENKTSTKTTEKLLLTNGAIFTSDEKNLHPKAVGVENGVIVAVGDKEEVIKTLGKDFETVDLKGNFLMPGLIDSHVHVGSAGFLLTTVPFPDDMKTVEEIKEFVEKNMAQENAWIENVLVFTNVSLSYWENIPLLNKVFNNEEFLNTPVILSGTDAHTGWANKAMLEYANLNEETIKNFPKVVSDSFGLNSDGTLNGFTAEGAWDEVLKKLPVIPDDKLAHGIKLGAEYMNSLGFTAWLDPIVNVLPLAPTFNAAPTKENLGLIPAYTTVIKNKDINAHVSALLLVNINSDEKIVDDVLAVKNNFDDINDFKIIGVKIFQDGVIEYPAQTAKLTMDYIGRENYSGPENIDENTYRNLIATLDKNNLVAHTHAVGDRATKEFLDAVEYTRKLNGNSNTKHSITHLEVVRPEDISRFKELNVDCAMQLLWAGKEPGTSALLKGSVPDQLLTQLYPANSLIKSGAVVGGASDWPVSTPNPFYAIYTATTRLGIEGLLEPESEIISRKDALYLYTINSAKVIERDKEIGSIEVGKKADFVLFDKNLETISSDELLNANVVWTMFDGKIIYENKN